MPHSLRAKLGGLRYKGIITDKDYQRLCKALDMEKVFDDIRQEILEETECHYGDKCLGANCPSNTDCMIMGEHAIWIIDKRTSTHERSRDDV